MNEHQLPTAGHTQLPCRGVADVSSFAYLSGNTTSDRPEKATAHTADRSAPDKLNQPDVNEI